MKDFTKNIKFFFSFFVKQYKMNPYLDISRWNFSKVDDKNIQ